MTPIEKNLRPILDRAMARPGRTCVYLFFDGEPTGGRSDPTHTSGIADGKG